MGEREVRWLRGELPGLVERGVLDPATADRLAAHYPAPPEGAGPRIALAIFGTLGAALVGGGVILLLAHNWDVLSRGVRAAVALGLLAAAQALVFFVLTRRADSPAWNEVAGVLLGAGVFSAVALVGQTYHVPGTLAAYLLTCALLLLPALYILDAPRVLTTVYWVAITAWFAGGPDPRPAAGWFLLLAAASAPVLMRLDFENREWRVPAGVMVVCLALAGSQASDVGGLDGSGLLYHVGLFALLATLPAARWTQPLAWAGYAGVPVLALMFSYEWVYRDRSGGSQALTVCAIAAGLAALAAVPAAWRARRRYAAVAAAALPVLALALVAGGAQEPAARALANLYLLALGLAAIADGLARVRLAPLNLGLAILAGHAAFRFFDRDLSFLVRGLAFVAVGLAFLGLNYRMLRRKRAAVRS